MNAAAALGLSTTIKPLFWRIRPNAEKFAASNNRGLVLGPYLDAGRLSRARLMIKAEQLSRPEPLDPRSGANGKAPDLGATPDQGRRLGSASYGGRHAKYPRKK